MTAVGPRGDRVEVYRCVPGGGQRGDTVSNEPRGDGQGSLFRWGSPALERVLHRHGRLTSSKSSENLTASGQGMFKTSEFLRKAVQFQVGFLLSKHALAV